MDCEGKRKMTVFVRKAIATAYRASQRRVDWTGSRARRDGDVDRETEE